MTTRTLALSAALFGTLSLGLFGCDDNKDDTGGDGGDGGSAVDEDCENGVDDDGDGDVDCEDDDCDCEEDDCTDGEDNDLDGDIDCEDSDCDCPEPDALYVYSEFGTLEGELGGVTYEGSEFTGIFSLYLVDSAAWDGLDDNRNACIIYYILDSSTAEWSSDFEDAGLWGGWQIDNDAAFYETDGFCDDLDPAVWGDDIADWANSFTWGIGMGDLDSSLRDAMKSWGSSYTDYEDNWVGGYVMTDYAGSLDIAGVNYGLAFEVDETGEIVVDGDGYLQPIDVTEQTFMPDAYVRLFMGYGWSL